MKFKVAIEPKEKASHRVTKAPEHLQLAVQVKKDWTMTWWDQFFILSKRTFKERCRDYFDKLRLVQALGVTMIFGAVYVFPFEKVYLVKERKADMYRLSVYYVSSTLCDMLAHIFYPTSFMLIVYFMAGFKRTVACFFRL